MKSKAVVLLSGGLDSTTLLYHLLGDVNEVHAISFNYGQRHKKELDVAHLIAHEAGVKHDVVWLGAQELINEQIHPFSTLIGGSSLTDESVPVPDGHYAEESMKATIVPNRNAIMISIAYGIAVAEGAHRVAFAAHAGDHAIYPDCRIQFVDALNDALIIGNDWADPRPYISAPFLGMSKTEIVRLASALEVPLDMTWSCYKGGAVHCGRCGTCVERKEAFRDAKVYDPTTYEDPGYLVAANAD